MSVKYVFVLPFPGGLTLLGGVIPTGFPRVSWVGCTSQSHCYFYSVRMFLRKCGLIPVFLLFLFVESSGAS